MKAYDVRIGDKFIHKDRMYLRIDMNLSQMSLTTTFPDMICALDLGNYKVMCINSDYEVELEGDNVFI